MKVFLIALGVAFLLLLPFLLIALLLALPVRLIVLYDRAGLRLQVKYLFFKYSEYTTENEKPDVKELLAALKKRRKKKRAKKPAAKKKVYEGERPETLKETLEVLWALIRDVLAPIVRSERFGIYVKKIRVDIGTENAADTAVAYGAVTGSLNALLGFLNERFSVRFGRRKDLCVRPRYDLEKTTADINIVFSMSLFRVLTSVVPELSKHYQL